MPRSSSPPERRRGLKEGAVVASAYLVAHKLGEGASGEVWAAVDTATGAHVALKVLAPGAAEVRELAERFRREAYFLARTASEHVARIHDFVCDPEVGMVLVMELVEGEPLSTVLDRGTLSVEEAIDLGLDLLAGVQVLHAKRVVHRDLKPGNILMRPSPDGRARPVICDFGLSRMAPRRGEESASVPSMTALTKGEVAMGTVKYMAPEQVLNANQATAQSDLYAVGAILQKAVTATPPFGALGSAGEIARAKVIGEAPPMSSGRSDEVARGFEQIVIKAVRRRPAERHADATAMRAELAKLADRSRGPASEGDTMRLAPAPVKSLPPESPTAPRHAPRRVALGAAMAALFVGGVVAGRAWRGPLPVVDAIVRTGGEGSALVRARTLAPSAPRTLGEEAPPPTDLDQVAEGMLPPAASDVPPATSVRKPSPDAVASLPHPRAAPAPPASHPEDNPY